MSGLRAEFYSDVDRKMVADVSMNEYDYKNKPKLIQSNPNVQVYQLVISNFLKRIVCNNFSHVRYKLKCRHS